MRVNGLSKSSSLTGLPISSIAPLVFMVKRCHWAPSYAVKTSAPSVDQAQVPMKPPSGE